MKYRYLLWLSLSFVAVTMILKICSSVLDALICISAIAAVIMILAAKREYRICALVFCIGAVMSVFWNSFYAEISKVPSEIIGKDINVTAEVMSFPQKSDNGRYSFIGVEIKNKKRNTRVNLCVPGTVSEISPGDEISFTADINEYENTESFSEKTYYRARYTDAFAYADKIDSVKKAERVSFRHIPAYLAKSLETNIDKLWSRENAAFFKALILGNKEELSKDFIKDLRATGMSHAVSVSGLHISFIAAFFLFFTKNKYIKLLIIPIIFMFALVVGAPQSALRAVIMQTVLLLSKVFRKESDSVTSVALAAMILVAINPYCSTDIAFLLSFSSTLGIVLLYDKIFIGMYPAIRETSGRIKKLLIAALSVLAISVAAALFTVPISAISFKYISTISPLSNLILSLPITVAFTAGFICAIAAFVCMPVSKGVAFLVGGVSDFITGTVKTLANMPFSEIYTGNGTTIVVICFICIAVVFAIAFGKRKVRKRITAIAIGVVTVTAVFASNSAKPEPAPAGTVRFDVLDVGQGQCVVVTKDDACIVIDCGGDKNAGDIALSHIAKSGIDDIDALVFTHAHADHANGAEYLLNSVKADAVYMPATDKNSSTFIDISHKTENPVFISKDTEIDVDGIRMCLLTLPQGSDENENGIVILIRNGENETLITGDIPAESEKLICGKLPDCESYIVGHHGSKTSSSQALLNRALPELAVISVGKENSYGHPNDETLTRLKNIGASVERTDISGTITFYSEG